MNKILWLLMSLLALLCVVDCFAQEPVTFIRYDIGDPHYTSNLPPVEIISYFPEFKMVYSGDVGEIESECKSGWKCFGYTFLTFAVPTKCESLNGDGSWDYGGYHFVIRGPINIHEKNEDDVRYALEITNKKNSKAYAIYSVSGGLESFGALVVFQNKQFLTQYYRSSRIPFLDGGCIARR
ncbi:MAG: hypothetical protein JSS45_13075 [Proteobacteria bacterium]|nr:hypothetical protein [Pseudomonadota bacterium]